MIAVSKKARFHFRPVTLMRGTVYPALALSFGIGWK